MKKFTITVISLFMVLLISLSAVGEAMGTSSKYASNQDYIQSENLALKDKSNKMTDGKDSSVYRFKTRNGGESIIDLGESCDFNSVILKEKGLNAEILYRYRTIMKALRKFMLTIKLSFTAFAPLIRSRLVM